MSDIAHSRDDAFEMAERMRLVIASVRDYAIFMLDEDGRVASWNAGAELAKGYKASEILGSYIGIFYGPEDRERDLPGKLLAEARECGRAENEGWRVRKDGSRFWADVIITALRNSDGSLVGYAKVTRDLTERRAADAERLRLARAEEAVRLRDEFLSIASHELKTPLTAIKLQLDTLVECMDELEPRVAKKIARAARGTGQLEALVESLLDVSRIASGRLTLVRKNVDLTATLTQLLDSLREPATRAGCALALIAPGPLLGFWDCMRIEQVVTNLISNATKYGAGEPVQIELSQEDASVLITVTDGGPGVLEDDQSRLFQRFERGAGTRNYGGLGLGLYVSRQIVEAHGGTIAVRNLPAGGACFTVRLPAAPPSTPSSIPE